MKRRLSDQGLGEPISPLIDIVANGMAAIFIILMIYMVIIPPVRPPAELAFLDLSAPVAISGQPYTHTIPAVGGEGIRVFEIGGGELPPGLEFDEKTGTIYGRVGPVGSTSTYSIDVSVNDDKQHRTERRVELKVTPAIVPNTQRERPLQLSRRQSELSSAIVGVPYEEVIGLTGWADSVEWSIDGPTPTGIELVDGRLQGTPVLPGTYAFTIRVELGSGSFEYGGVRYEWDGETDAIEYSMVVYPKPSSTLRLPLARAGEEYMGGLLFEGATDMATVGWRGVIPGLTPGSNGAVLVGVPTSAGTHEFSYDVSVEGSEVVQGHGILEVLPPRPPPSLAGGRFEGTVGNNVSWPLSYQGLVEPVEIEARGEFPEGLELVNNTVLGEIRTTGAYAVELVARDARGAEVNSRVTLDLRHPLGALRLELPERFEVSVGHVVAIPIAASAGTGHYEWIATGLPTGMTLANGTLRGKIEKRGTWRVGVAVEDQLSEERASGEVSIVAIHRDETKPQIRSPESIVAVMDHPFTITPRVSGGVGNTRVEIEPVPDEVPCKGLRVAQGAITGTPKSPGSCRYELVAKDSVGQQDGPRALEIRVVSSDPMPPEIKDCALPTATIGEPYTQRIAAQGGTGRHTWTLVGDLPEGLSFEDGSLMGVPSTELEPGSSALEFSVEDASGRRSDACNATLELLARRDKCSSGKSPLGETSQALDPPQDTVPPQAEPKILVDRKVVAIHGKPLLRQFFAVGLVGPTTWTVRGLPEGVTLDPERGVIGGMAKLPGVYELSVVVRDEAGRSAEANVVLDVLQSEFTWPIQAIGALGFAIGALLVWIIRRSRPSSAPGPTDGLSQSQKQSERPQLPVVRSDEPAKRGLTIEVDQEADDADVARLVSALNEAFSSDPDGALQALRDRLSTRIPSSPEKDT